MTETIVITFLAYLVVGAVPPIVAAFLFRATFIGGLWAAMLVGIIAAVIGGLVDTLFLVGIPDLLPVAGFVDIAPPLAGSVLFTILFALISRSNKNAR